MDHPNLSKEINDNIAKSEFLGGVYTKDIKPNTVVSVKTKNSTYHISTDLGKFYMSGGIVGDKPQVVKIQGSTWGGSMLKTGFIGIGMHMEFSVMGPGNQRITYTTSQIKEIQ